MKTWYAVYTKKNCEKNILSKLNKYHIECIFFLNHINANEKSFNEPLFPSYVFVNATNSELKKILQLIEVINPVYWKNTPITFSDNEIEGLKIFTKNNINIKKIKNNPLDEIDFNGKKGTTGKNIYLFTKLNIVLIGEIIKSPVIKFYKKESFSRTLFRMGINFFS